MFFKLKRKIVDSPLIRNHFQQFFSSTKEENPQTTNTNNEAADPVTLEPVHYYS